MPFTFTTIPFQTLMRAAAVALISGYANSIGLRIQIYPARPKPLMVPSAFVDLMREETAFTGPTQRQRTVTAEILAVWGLFDSLEAVKQRDAFCDGFADYVTDHRDQADPHSVIASVVFQDTPAFVPDWIDPDEQKVYYATRIALEGYVSA
jgi:hypothetical protein